MATPQLKNPCPEGLEIYNFGRPFLDYHNYTELCPGVEKINFFVSLPCRCCILNWPSRF